MSEYAVRRANLSDIEQLVQLFESYRIFYKKEPNQKAASDFLKKRLVQNDSVFFICSKDQQIGAFTQLYPIFSSTRMKRLWLLNDLFVSNEYRGEGLSKLLIQRCKDYCHETDACGLILETGKSNDIGNRLYPSVGFILDEKYNHYFWDV
jgi:GNAT superfamily N-acetyltransferase